MRPGGVHTMIAMHCGFKIFKMAAKVEKFCRIMLYFSIDTVLSLDCFSRFHKLIFV